MKISGDKVFGTFLARPNRFEALVEIDGEVNRVHVPNTGRMTELLHIGTRVVLVKAENPNRKTKYSLIFVYKQDHLICINSILANKVFEEGVRNGTIDIAKGDIIREYPYGKSRLDFLIAGEEKTLVEVKCCTYEENNHARFPDAPTERGRKHIDELIRARKEGYKAEVIILAFMDYVDVFSPNYKVDKEFGELLKLAHDKGVRTRVFRCKIETFEVSIDKEIKLIF